MQTNVECEANTLGAVTVEPVRDGLRLLDGGAADDDAGDASLKQGFDDLQGADATANLEVDLARRGKIENEATIRERTVARAIEVDQMQPWGASRHVAIDEAHGLEVVAGLAREVALQQPHAATATKIDGRDEFHVFAVMKLASKRAPD